MNENLKQHYTERLANLRNRQSEALRALAWLGTPGHRSFSAGGSAPLEDDTDERIADLKMQVRWGAKLISQAKADLASL